MCPHLLFTYASLLKALKQMDNYHPETMSFAHTEVISQEMFWKDHHTEFR